MVERGQRVICIVLVSPLPLLFPFPAPSIPLHLHLHLLPLNSLWAGTLLSSSILFPHCEFQCGTHESIATKTTGSLGNGFLEKDYSF